MKRLLTRVLIGLVVLVALAGLGFVVFSKIRTAAPLPEAIDALESSADVVVTTEKRLVFEPRGTRAETGLVIYPGGYVDPRAYAPVAHGIAARGFLVTIVPMPFNLAVLGAGRAANVMADFPEIEQWAVGGHSLGGAMAAQFAHGNPAQVAGLVLWAAYPPDGNPLQDSDLAVLSIYGTRDGITTLDETEASRALLPPDTVFVAIEGGNHAGFGSYGPQSGDGTATMERSQQQAQVVDATASFLRELAPGR
jgi:hypothetical protein